MARFVIRLDVEVEAINQDDTGQKVNYLVDTAVDMLGFRHYQWALTQGKLNDPDTEKNLRQATLQTTTRLHYKEKL